MKPLASNQRVLTWLCLLPPTKGKNGEEECKTSVSLVVVLILTDLAVFVTCLWYILKFTSLGVQDITIAMCQFLGSIPMANSLVVAFFLRHRIPPAFEKLSKFYEKRILI